ncbi:MAG: amino acid permease [Gammaproteobacteria bacterium CG_4_10_14_0_8_um_filter_38_16]|nr:MAG: amino acid permease [Gammaproteobacteria bacterium CG_4_10_14_0_8_um_filter_38_16]PJA03632.1 MAG: amino acid permease [Gammaproteobacteria bacterium CG_4_10_14_0_2_um_filter_38_22]PJB09953.1 MAG: amino acid permease [Gammaproteobacteria bacterium CG_4_9_14_3_um_filter_38_9]
MKNKKIGLFVLVMFIVGSIDSLRNMPSNALFGAPLIFFFVAAAITFLFPIALISAELTSYHPDKNGIYLWIKEAFGEKVAFLGIWLQWINTATWYPSILSYIAGGIAYLADPSLATSKLFAVIVILTVFWSLTLLSVKNFSLSAGFATFCTVAGFVLPFCVMATLAIIWKVDHHAVQIQLNWHTLVPQFSNINDWISLTTIITAFLGMELATVNVQNIKKPERNYPIGVISASFIILLTMIVGSLAIALVIPQKQIGLTTGIFETFQYYLNAFHLNNWVYIVCALVVLASIGEMINWIISPARGLQQAAETGTLPKALAKNNQHGMPANILILQAILVSLVCLAFTLFKTVNDIYWLLTDLSTELYVLMYVFMFLAALSLHYKHRHIKKPFTIPGGTPMKWILCVLGLISCFITLIVGFIPPSELDFGSRLHYALVFAAGLLILCLPGIILMKRKSI